METPQQPDLNMQARAYFLQQGQRIARLNDLLNSNIITHHIGKVFSVLLEITLYLLFVILVIYALSLPTAIEGSYDDGYNAVGGSYTNKDIIAVIIVVKFLLIILSLPLLIIARLLGRNRRKNSLIYQASVEANKMKEEFDKAVRELKL